MSYKTELIWEVSQGKEKQIIADIISLALNHEDWDENKIILALLSIDKWHKTLPSNIKKLIDENRLDEYEIVIREVEGLPI